MDRHRTIPKGLIYYPLRKIDTIIKWLRLVLVILVLALVINQIITLYLNKLLELYRG